MTTDPETPVMINEENTGVSASSTEYAVEVRNVTKTYQIYQSDLKRTFGTMGFKVEHDTFVALDDMTYSFEKGEVTAILGRNGSGKSTLLKLITGVTFCDEGTIESKGRISAILELRSGFDKELTGEENIYYKALTMGIPTADIERVKDDIIAFADLGPHINEPFRTYSSGMKARLGFAVSVNINPDILIVDEVLAVGDDVFKMKCIAKMNEFRRQGKTILFVSHDLNTVKAFCTRAIWINKGQLMAEGDMGEVVVEYAEFLKEQRAITREKRKAASQQEVLTSLDIVEPLDFHFVDSNSRPALGCSFGEPWGFALDYNIKKEVSSLTLGFSILNAEKIEVYSSDRQAELRTQVGNHTATVMFDQAQLMPGRYYVNAEIWDTASAMKVVAAHLEIFTIEQSQYVGTGISYLSHEIMLDKALPEEPE